MDLKHTATLIDPPNKKPVSEGSVRSPQILFNEAQFVPLQSQSNIYGLVVLCVSGSCKLVVATLRGVIYCLDYHKPSIQRPPSLSPINFNYIPGGRG